jgi:hypothetical protein
MMRAPAANLPHLPHLPNRLAPPVSMPRSTTARWKGAGPRRSLIRCSSLLFGEGGALPSNPSSRLPPSNLRNRLLHLSRLPNRLCLLPGLRP